MLALDCRMQTLPMEACYLLFLESSVYTVPYHLQNPLLAMLGIRIWICKIRMFLGLPDRIRYSGTLSHKGIEQTEIMLAK
jgi:hypothetical protein